MVPVEPVVALEPVALLVRAEPEARLPAEKPS